jgi:cytochrome c-type biogenesis protein CcmH
MTNFVLLSVLLGALAMALLLRPLWWPFAAGAVHPSPALSAGVVVFAAAIAIGGYALVGSPAHLALGPWASQTGGLAGSEGAGADSGSHSVTPEQIAAMVDRLAQRLKEQPNDPEGWTMLARSYVAMGRHADAVPAFEKAAALRPDDADLLSDYADALAMAQGRTLQGRPAELVQRALKADPRNPKALALAGTIDFERKDYAAAVKHWQALVEADPQGELAQQIRGSIEEARQLGGLPAAAPSSDVQPAAAAAAGEKQGGTAAGATVSGTVRLSPRLASRVSPGDTVFIFARASQGPRMPLAIQRHQAKELPLQFTLDDSMAMSPQAKLSGASRVDIGARISKSGNAMPQPGDLQGVVREVAVGSHAVTVEIDEELAR